MKSNTLSNLLLICFFILSSSCNKEKSENKSNGGFYSVQSEMILGDWRLHETIEGDGTIYTLPADEIIKWKIEANGVFTEIHDYFNTYDSSIYLWKLTNYDRNLMVIDEDQDSNESPIFKLTQSQLWFKDDNDGYQAHFEKL